MRRFVKILGVVLAGLAASACTQVRPAPVAGCDYDAIPMTVSGGHPRAMRPELESTPDALLQVRPEDRFATELRGAMAARRAIRAQERRPGTTTPDQDQMLVLSGGGQHGAFGAGLFYGLDHVPTYDIVTGVSTGSLQSTLLFLANSPVPDDRTDYGWVDGPLSSPSGPYPPGGFPARPHVSNVGDLALAYSIDREGDLMKLNFGGPAGMILKGAAASFGPLRARLRAIVTIGTLRQVGEQFEEEKRSLYVGVVNLDDGVGYAINMTKLAARARHTDSPAELRMIQDCYVDAMVASSSVPPGVPPVTLETDSGTSMYMDGGARFGVFLEQVLRALGQAAPANARVTVIVNNYLYGGPWQPDGKPTQSWSVATFGLRAVGILEDQVYRFSVADAEKFGVKLGGLRMAFMSNENIPGGEAPDDHRFQGKTCSEWSEFDALKKPLQFHPWYMACIADYGRARGAADQWNRAVR